MNKHRFVILIGNKLHTYEKYEDIPEVFDNVIEFSPHIPEGPHNHNDHEEINKWGDKLKELMKKEKR